MFAKMRTPAALAPSDLDHYLSQGWFRMRQTIFTTSFLHFNNRCYSVLWLRVALDRFLPCKKYGELNKINSKFKTEIKPLDLTAAHEALYQLYRQSVSFDVSPTLHDLLVGNEAYNRFDTYQVNVFDGNKLIAAGFFDLGKTSAAGISSIYHPEYKKYSLGKYLIFLKIDFCMQNSLAHFYPGYLVPGYRAFDYKTEIGKGSLEWLQFETGYWLPYQSFNPAMSPMICMEEKLLALRSRLTKHNIHSAVMYYKFFDASLDPHYSGDDLFEFPIFLYHFITPDHYDMIVYNVKDAQYHLLQCSPIAHLDYYSFSNNIFNSCLLKINKSLLITSVADEIADMLPTLYG